MGFKGFGKFGFGGFRKPRINDLRGIFVDHLGRLHAGRGNVLITELGILFPATDYQTYVQWRTGDNNDESYIYANALLLALFTRGQLYFHSLGNIARFIDTAIQIEGTGFGFRASAGGIQLAGDTFIVSPTTGDLSKIRNVAYSFPASQGAASTYLQNDGAGALAWATAAALVHTHVAADITDLTAFIVLLLFDYISLDFSLANNSGHLATVGL